MGRVILELIAVYGKDFLLSFGKKLDWLQFVFLFDFVMNEVTELLAFLSVGYMWWLYVLTNMCLQILARRLFEMF